MRIIGVGLALGVLAVCAPSGYGASLTAGEVTLQVDAQANVTGISVGKTELKVTLLSFEQRPGHDMPPPLQVREQLSPPHSEEQAGSSGGVLSKQWSGTMIWSANDTS